jgi:hypothetical protein
VDARLGPPELVHAQVDLAVVGVAARGERVHVVRDAGVVCVGG